MSLHESLKPEATVAIVVVVLIGTVPGLAFILGFYAHYLAWAFERGWSA